MNGKRVVVNPDVGEALQMANALMIKAGKPGLDIRSSYRDIEVQKKLYDEYLAKLKANPGKVIMPVARPGFSKHQQGMAVDIHNWQEAAPFLAQVGLVNTVKNDPIHFIPDQKKLQVMTAGVGGGPSSETKKAASEALDSSREGTGKQIARTVSPYLRPTLEVGGSIAGGALAAPFNLIAPGVAEALGVGGGYATGKMAADLFDEMTGIKEQTPPWEKIKEAVVTDIPTMAALGPVGSEVLTSAMGLGELTKPGVKAAMDAADKAAIPAGRQATVAAAQALSERTGVPLAPDQQSLQRSTAYMRQQLNKHMATSDEAAAFADEQQAAMQNYSQRVLHQDLGGAPDSPASAGQAVKDAAWERSQAFQKKAGKIYDSIPVNPETPIATPALRQAGTEHAEAIGKLESPAVKRVLGVAQSSEETQVGKLVDASGNPLTKETVPTYTWEQLRADQSELGKLAEKTKDWHQKSILNDLRFAINDDIAAFAESVDNPEIKKRLDLANKYYRHGDSIFGPPPADALPGVETWKDAQIRNMMRTKSPEDIGRGFFKAQPNESDIMRLKSVAGTEPYNEMLQSWFQDLVTRGEDFSFSPQRFQTAYENYRRSGNLDVMLTAKQRAGIDDLYELSRRINKMERATGNPSGTGQTMVNDLGKWLSHPLTSAMQTIGMKRLAKLYFTDPGWQATFAKGLRYALKEGAKGLAPGPKTYAVTRQILRTGLIAEEDTKANRRLLPAP
jgi:hypothetical protein